MRIKLKNLIEKISFKKHIKILLLIFSIIGIFSGFTFADGLACTEDSVKSTFVEILYDALTFLSRGWIVFANLAGKFMTNDAVYGTFLHLDSTLWTFWNVMKNIANFLLGFLVLYSILKNLLTPTGLVQSKPLDTIKNTLIAGILIQMSWFLVGVALDISTICTAAIGSFPAQFMTIDNEFQSDVRNTILYTYNHKLIVDYNSNDYIRVETGGHAGNNVSDDEVNQLLDTILPSTDSLSGPLIYIGMAIFDFRDFNVHRPDECSKWGNMLLSVGLDGAVVIAYSIIMLLLFIFNLMRILILWIVIPSIPLIIVAKVFDFKLENSLGEIANIGNILKLIFKPVLMVGILSIVLIIMVLIKGIINNDHGSSKVEIPNTNLTMTTEENGSSMDIEGLLNVNLDGYKEGFAGVVVYILGICLMCFVLKMAAFKTGISFIDDKIKLIFDKTESFMTTAPIIPIPGKKPISIDNIYDYAGDRDLLSSAVGWSASEQNDIVRGRLNMDNTWDGLSDTLSKTEFIEKAETILTEQYNINTHDQFIDELKKSTNNKISSVFWPRLSAWKSKHPNEKLDEREEFFKDK